MTSYFFVVPSLPPIILGEKPELRLSEFRMRLAWNLSSNDMGQIEVLGRYEDILNVRSLIAEEPISFLGNLSEKELDEALLVQGVFPEYVFDVLDKYEGTAAKITHFSELIVRFFQEEIAARSGFLRSYLEFERNWRLVLLGIRAKELGRDVTVELQYEDPYDPLVAEILAGRDSEKFIIPSDYLSLQEQLAFCGKDPWEQYKAFAKWRFQKIEDLVEGKNFSIDAILAYGAQLMIAEEWYALDEEQGSLLLHTLYTA